MSVPAIEIFVPAPAHVTNQTAKEVGRRGRITGLGQIGSHAITYYRNPTQIIQHATLGIAIESGHKHRHSDVAVAGGTTSRIYQAKQTMESVAREFNESCFLSRGGYVDQRLNNAVYRAPAATGG
jgi:hypothetical protein